MHDAEEARFYFIRTLIFMFLRVCSQMNDMEHKQKIEISNMKLRCDATRATWLIFSNFSIL